MLSAFSTTEETLVLFLDSLEQVYNLRNKNHISFLAGMQAEEMKIEFLT